MVTPIRPTVLIVDDDKKFLTFLTRTLKRGGFYVMTAHDGCEVPDLLKQSRVDVLLLDLQMPGMNGWEVMRQLRTKPSNGGSNEPPYVPKVVVLSGRNEDETAAFVRRLGADAYLTKPSWGDQILATVRGVLTN
ncbi:MAG TPA: response regulator [Candidatus Margulisiibacteriota bacterium]|nr:response regulator [Candidatus Margulisiibacteriota bacterium]